MPPSSGKGIPVFLSKPSFPICNLCSWVGLSPFPLVPRKGTCSKHSVPPGSSDWFMGKFTSGISGAIREEMRVVRISVQQPCYHFKWRSCLKLKLNKRKTEERWRYWGRQRKYQHHWAPVSSHSWSPYSPVVIETNKLPLLLKSTWVANLSLATMRVLTCSEEKN